MQQRLSVAVLGTGIMGARMAARMVGAGLAVRTWDRTPARARAVAGAEAFEHPNDAVDNADVVVTMLSDGEATEALVAGRQGVLRACKDRAIWLQMATIGVAATERLAGLAAQAGLRFVDAPVLGSTGPAEEGRLVVLAAGPDDAIEEARPVLEAVGRRTIPLGPAGRASALKLVVNAWLVASVAGLVEAFALADALGLEPVEFLGAIAGGPLDMPYARDKARAMLSERLDPGFPLKHALKDALLAQGAALDRGLDAKVLDAAAFRLGAAVDAGLGDLDVAAAWLPLRRDPRGS